MANGVSFVRLADELADRHDVVIMNHYLEHTREPFDELDTAARVVLPGGYPLTEVHPALVQLVQCGSETTSFGWGTGWVG